MNKCIYFDCFAGASGDMIVGALLDLGVDFNLIKTRLSRLPLEGFELHHTRVTRSSISAARFEVKIDRTNQVARHLHDIRKIIENAGLSNSVKLRSLAVFDRLAKAEAEAHGTSPDKVHFHEIGAVDSIVDIVGTMICLEILGVDRFLCSPLRVGHGQITTEHGLLPIPAPGTARLLLNVPIYAGDVEGEFVTPTGAAILTTLCESFGSVPPMQIEATGYGAGTRDPQGFPNVLRVFSGAVAHGDNDPEAVMVIETNIDDMNPQAYGFLMDRVFDAGALDAFTTPVQMKKGRPGVLVTVLCSRGNLDAITNVLLTETTTLGVRYHETRRRVLQRIIEKVETPYGVVAIKVAREGSRTLHFQPEYEDCVRLASESGVPLIEVQSAASAAYRQRTSGKES